MYFERMQRSRATALDAVLEPVARKVLLSVRCGCIRMHAQDDGRPVFDTPCVLQQQMQGLWESAKAGLWHPTMLKLVPGWDLHVRDDDLLI